MRVSRVRSDWTDELDVIVNFIFPGKCARYVVDDAKRVGVRRPVGLWRTAQDLDRGRVGEVLPSDRFARHGEGEPHSVARLLGREVGDRGGDQRRWRNRIARRAATCQEKRKSENRNPTIEKGNAK